MTRPGKVTLLYTTINQKFHIAKKNYREIQNDRIATQYM